MNHVESKDSVLCFNKIDHITQNFNKERMENKLSPHWSSSVPKRCKHNVINRVLSRAERFQQRKETCMVEDSDSILPTSIR